MPRFVILRHDWAECDRFQSEHHWDLLFETSGAGLETWSTETDPLTQQSNRSVHEFLAIKLPAHRSVYLTYEGPISGNRGSVSRILSGHYNRAELVKPTQTGDPISNLSSENLFERDHFSLKLFWHAGIWHADFKKISADQWKIRLASQLIR